jgi:hypothetical protein
MTLQLDGDGLQTQTQQQIADELAELLRDQFGVNLVTSTDSLMGQIVNILAELRAIDQQALLSVYRSFDPNGAQGAALDARLTLTGSVRQGALSSVVDGVLTFSGVATMSNGDLIKNDGNASLWELTDGPHTSAGPFPEVIAAQFTAVETGPTLANAGTTWSEVTVIPDLDGFTNASDDANPGRSQETDADARKRRLVELYSQGQGPLATLRGAVSKVVGVTTARVYHNPTINPIDADGIPFKAFNVVVETNPSVPGAALQQAIFDAIWSSTGGGGYAYGSDFVGQVVDSEGTPQPAAFDTVTLRDVELEIDLVTSTSEDPITANIEAVVAEQIIAIAQANHELAGRDVRALDYSGIVYALLAAGTISGVDAVVVRMSFAPAAPAAVDKLDVGIRERPDFDSGQITVVQI